MMLRFLLFVVQIFYTCGKVIVLRGESVYIKSSSSTYRGERKYICLSEDDGGALVWNDDLLYNQYQQENRTDLQFHSTHLYNTWINCNFNAKPVCVESQPKRSTRQSPRYIEHIWKNCTFNTTIKCLDSWDRKNWSLTDATRTPMGPVFDQRWEEFREEQLQKGHYSTLASKSIPKAGAISISLRSWKHVNISVCLFIPPYTAIISYQKKLCFDIKLRCDNTASMIVYETNIGLNNTRDQQRFSNNTISKKLLPLSGTEWRTFVISWDFWNRNVSIYDTNDNNKMLTFEDTEKFSNNSPMNDYYSTIRIRMDHSTHSMCRFHEYTFLYTVDKNAVLTTRYYKPNTQKICIQILLGLCAECDADIVMMDSTTHKMLHSVTAKGSINAAIHNLPMWQLVKLDRDFLTDTYIKAIKIRVIPKLTKPTPNPLWAIAHVRQCPNKEILRKGIILQSNNGNDIPLSNITCQKLYFNENIVVSSLGKPTNRIALHDKICPEEKIGPNCSFSCEHDLNSPSNCEGTAICYKSGCVCSPGFQGNTCSDSCDDNWYGYNCANKCGLCKSLGCNKVTGECINGCVDTLKIFYLPPLCHIGLDKLTEPEIVSITSTSIRVKHPIVWKEEYEKIQITYSFAITGENDYIFTQSWNRLFQNMTYLIGYFNNLNPGSVYSVKCMLLAENEIIESKWQSVETDCESAKTFNILSTENSIIIDWQNTSNQVFSCPAHWYYATLQNENTGENISNSTVITFPHEVSHLPSYTPFNVIVMHPRLVHTIIKQRNYLFHTQIRTLRSVSTKVLDIQYVANSSTQVTLKWNSPDHLTIVLYKITLK
ncbi:uncharacterized protein LOC109858051, partial [Pseudomyrmex gracilis]|uniref:uncharacterized protein LOC109858051 n=1 Tax=Pseudomyrmex gracilis TaxID=219809 RepID=UPI000994B75B